MTHPLLNTCAAHVFSSCPPLLWLACAPLAVPLIEQLGVGWHITMTSTDPLQRAPLAMDPNAIPDRLAQPIGERCAFDAPGTRDGLFRRGLPGAAAG